MHPEVVDFMKTLLNRIDKDSARFIPSFSSSRDVHGTRNFFRSCLTHSVAVLVAKIYVEGSDY